MGEEPRCHELGGVLLDSYSLHPGHRVSVCQTVANHTPYSMCVALSSPDDYSTTIAITKYSGEDPRTELQAEVGTGTCCTHSKTSLVKTKPQKFTLEFFTAVHDCSYDCSVHTHLCHVCSYQLLHTSGCFELTTTVLVD